MNGAQALLIYVCPLLSHPKGGRRPHDTPRGNSWRRKTSVITSRCAESTGGPELPVKTVFFVFEVLFFLKRMTTCLKRITVTNSFSRLTLSLTRDPSHSPRLKHEPIAPMAPSHVSAKERNTTKKCFVLHKIHLVLLGGTKRKAGN